MQAKAPGSDVTVSSFRQVRGQPHIEEVTQRPHMSGSWSTGNRCPDAIFHNGIMAPRVAAGIAVKGRIPQYAGARSATLEGGTCLPSEKSAASSKMVVVTTGSPPRKGQSARVEVRHRPSLQGPASQRNGRRRLIFDTLGRSRRVTAALRSGDVWKRLPHCRRCWL